MLCYVYRRLATDGYRKSAAENFDSAADLFAQLLAYGIKRQIRSGITKEYIRKEDVLAVVRGRLDMTGTARQYAAGRRRLACTYDEFSENCMENRIIKAAVSALLRSSFVNADRKRSLKRCLWYFSEVDEIPVRAIPWADLPFHRRNPSSRALLNLCRLVLDDLLPTMNDGDSGVDRLAPVKFMYKLFEDFIRAFYKTHYPELYRGAKHIAWNLRSESKRHLPIMMTDLILEGEAETLVVEAKYYSTILNRRGGFSSSLALRSGHLYQIYAYVHNLQHNSAEKVCGLLLYANTGEPELPDNTYVLGGNRITVTTIDLRLDFAAIERRLHEIIRENLSMIPVFPT